MAPGVTTLKQPLAIRPDYIATHSTSIRVNQHRPDSCAKGLMRDFLVQTGVGI